ncbi:hypothetical protein [Caenispirillum bisanense]|uniref:Uncharacterized protein n=1 Tax=Caenispirillum bisanense TaxID=414052 RepID=A0A286GLK2_9PROT|nr:hypothetical protein [Caenispirillum bisanense]SOD95979.1 hypothetical protein SAMN05421508_10591 [Caenispirillum bisanense]
MRLVSPVASTHAGPPHRRPAPPPGAEAARAVAEVVRITLLDDAGREDMRDHLARRAAAARLGFAAQCAAEAAPPLPAPLGLPHPGAAAATACYRAVAAVAETPATAPHNRMVRRQI